MRISSFDTTCQSDTRCQTDRYEKSKKDQDKPGLFLFVCFCFRFCGFHSFIKHFLDIDIHSMLNRPCLWLEVFLDKPTALWKLHQPIFPICVGVFNETWKTYDTVFSTERYNFPTSFSSIACKLNSWLIVRTTQRLNTCWIVLVFFWIVQMA